MRFLTSEQFDAPAQVEDDRGVISRMRTWNSFELDWRVNPTWSLRLDAELELDGYDIRHSERILAGTGTLLDAGVRTHLEPGVDWRVGRDWKVGADVAFETTGVPGASLSDSFTVGTSAYVWHRFSPSIALRFGVSVFAYLDDDPLIIPFIAPDDVDASSPTRWRFEGRGTGGRLGYAVTPKLTAGIAGAYDRRDWRLASDDRAPGGIARDIRVSFGAFVEVTPWKRFTLGLEGGVTVHHEFEVADRDGNALVKVDLEPSGYLGFSLSWRF